jgi:hypothetical protein
MSFALYLQYSWSLARARRHRSNHIGHFHIGPNDTNGPYAIKLGRARSYVTV